MPPKEPFQCSSRFGFALEFNATAHFRQREGGNADFSGMPREPILNRVAKTEVITYDVRIRQVFQNRHGGTLSVWAGSNVKPWATRASKWSAKFFLASLTSRVRRRALLVAQRHKLLPAFGFRFRCVLLPTFRHHHHWHIQFQQLSIEEPKFSS